MNKIIVAILIGILLTTSLIAVKSAYASSWDSNMHENSSKDKQINQSHHIEYSKHKVIKQKAYGWHFSKVCGLELCTNAKKDTASTSFLQGHGVSGAIPTQKTTFDGHYYLKGYNQYQNITSTITNSTK